MAQLGYRVMDTQIFNLKLSVLATSAYILICSLVGEGLLASDQAILERWNESHENLQAALVELQLWRVIEKRNGPEEKVSWSPNPASLWRVPGTL
ncbi:MAG: hypothetical protein LBE80_04460 [Deltaproteobacteria bacterium]|jgi:hypothetical protein|nr:hypothetical protein [Deltaproteobacteria bacterium]